MMVGWTTDWFRVFELPGKALQDIENRLFQMNIHDLPLFPDLEALAGFIGQKIRLQWSPTDLAPVSI